MYSKYFVASGRVRLLLWLSQKEKQTTRQCFKVLLRIYGRLTISAVVKKQVFYFIADDVHVSLTKSVTSETREDKEFAICK